MSEDLRDPNRAVDFIVKNAESFANAKGDRVYLEEFRKTKKAILMGQSDGKTVSEREQFAYSHPEYLEVLAGLKDAVIAEENLKWKLEAARIRVDIWRSQEASNRGQDRATR